MNSIFSSGKFWGWAGFLLAVLFIVWKLKTPPAVGGDVLTQLTPDEQAKRHADAQQVTNEVGVIKQESARHERAPFTLVVTQDQLNTLMQSTPQARDTHGEIQPGRLVFQATVPYRGVDVTATLGGTVQADSGRLAFHADSLQLDGVTGPSDMKDQGEQMVNGQLGQLVDPRSTVTSVTADAGQLTIVGTTA